MRNTSLQDAKKRLQKLFSFKAKLQASKDERTSKVAQQATGWPYGVDFSVCCVRPNVSFFVGGFPAVT